MKKITLLFLLGATFTTLAQQKTTGVVNLLSNTTATLVLDNATSTATLTLSGPNDRWFALQFGSFTNEEGMIEGLDVVYWNNTTLVDAVQNGVGVTPSTDAVNNWTLVSNLNNTPANGLRTVVFSRPFVTGDANDYQFNFSDTSIDFAHARRSSAGFALNNHGFSNRGYVIDRPLTTLGVEDFSLKSAQVYPNPATNFFTIESKTEMKKVSVYTQTGALVTSYEVPVESANSFNVNGLQTGVYLIQIENDTDKAWKKVIIQ